MDGQVGPHTWSALHRSPAHHRRSAITATIAGTRDGILRLGDKGKRVAEVQRRLGIRVNRLFDQRT